MTNIPLIFFRWMTMTTLLAATLSSAAATTHAESADLTFEQHNLQGTAAWHQQEYQQALQHFLAASKLQQSAALHHNIGNVLMQLDRTGLAIAHYSKSLALDPTHPDTRANLNLARQKLGLSPPPVSLVERYAQWLPLNHWILIAAGAFWCSAACLLLPRYLRIKSATVWSLRSCTLAVLFAAIIALGGYHKLAQYAVVIDEDSGVQPSPTHQSQPSTYVHEGEIVQITGSHREFYQIITPSGQSGWVQGSHIVPIWDHFNQNEASSKNETAGWISTERYYRIAGDEDDHISGSGAHGDGHGQGHS